MKFKKFSCLVLSLAFFTLLSVGQIYSQGRPRVVQSTPTAESDTSENVVQEESSTVRQNYPPSPTVSKRPSLNQNIVIIGTAKSEKTVTEKKPLGNFSSPIVNQRLLRAIQTRIGIPYRYGSTGPNSYDCSGLVWSVFQDAGIYFERSSASTFWRTFEPVSETEKYKFGTLVFFNRLGHVGIVVDENGFYHASSSKGVTYSPFAGYWGKRIVGFRRIPQIAD